MSLFPRVSALAISLALFACADPARAGLGVGPVDPIDPVRFAAVDDQDQVAAADNGAVTLYVWRDRRRGDPDVFAARVRHDGTVLDPNGIEIAGGPGDQGEPSVSWDGTQWLVAWTEGSEVRIQRVTVSGALPDLPTTLSNPSAVVSHPGLAWNGQLHLVVWSEAAVGQQQIHGATVDDNGAVVASAAVVTLGTSNRQPSLAALGANALLAFTSQRQGNDDIYGVRVTAALPSGAITRLDVADVVIENQGSAQEAPAVAASGTGWLVAWQDSRDLIANGHDVRGKRVTSAGAVLDNSGIVIANEDGHDRDVALAHDGSRWLATWTGEDGQILRSIANNGNPANSTVSVSNAPGQVGDGAFGGAPANPTIAWGDSSLSEPGRSDLMGRRVGAALALDPPFAIATQTPNQTEPAQAFGANRWMIAWVDDRFGADRRQIRFGVTDSARFSPPNPSTIAFAAPRVGLDQGRPTLAYDGTNFNLFWDEERAGRRIVCGARFSAGGAPIDTFTVAGDSWNQYEPSAFAYKSGEVLLAWTDSRVGPTERDIWAVVLTNGSISEGPGTMANQVGVREEHPAATGVQDSTRLVAYETSAPDRDRAIEAAELDGELGIDFMYHHNVAKATGKTYERPRIAQNGEDALIVYQEVVFSDGPSLHIPWARRFHGDSGYFSYARQIAPGSYTPANPVVGSASYDYVPVWSTRATGNIDVATRAVDPDGEPLVAAPIALTNDPVIDTPGAATQGLGDRVGFSFMRSLSDTAWSGLQLYGGEAQDTLVGRVVINEFLAHPYGSSAVGEYYELFNVSGRSFLLNGWKLHIDGNSNQVVDCPPARFLSRGRETQSDPSTPPAVAGTPCSYIDNQAFFTDFAFEGYPTDPEQGSLPDRGAVLELFSPGGTLVDRVGYGYKGGAPVSGAIPIGIAPAAKTPPGGEASVMAVGDSVDLSTARIPNGTDTGNDAADFNATSSPTPNDANTGTASALGTTLFVSRAYWNPSTGEPTVEFLNPSTNQTYDFAGWYLSNNVSTEKIGVNTNAFSQMKSLATRLLRRGEPGSFTFRMDELSVLYLYDANFTRYEQLGWSRPDQIAPDMCVTRLQGTGGTHDGFDWFTCGGQDNISTGELRYTTCSIQAPTTDVPPTRSKLSFAGAWPNPSRPGQSPVIVFTVPGTMGDAPVRARLALYDVAGRRVSLLVDDNFTPGEQRVPLSRVDHARQALRAGTYYADLEIGGQRLRRTLVFLN